MNSLYDAYIQKHPAVLDRFTASPESLFVGGLAENNWTPGVAHAVNALQEELGCGKEQVSGREPVIVTGQQTGLFTGPLYTILKAVSAIQLAAKLQEQGRAVIPVFWGAADDHDLAEVQTAHFLTRTEKVLSLTYTPDPDVVAYSDFSMFRIPLSPLLHDHIETAADACRSAGNITEVEEFLHDSLSQSASVAAWFSRLMAGLFRGTPLRIFEPQREAARLAALPVLRQEIESPLESTRLLVESGRQIESFGYDLPIKTHESSCNFFVEDAGRRRKVNFKDNRYFLSGLERSWTVEEMLALLESEPWRFSPNVALRPVVQQSLFNPAAYVAGPGEIAYWAQLKPLFSFFGVSMPVVYPRISAVLLTGKLKKFLDAYRLTLSDVAQSDDLLVRTLREAGDTPLSAAFYRERREVERALEKMAVSLRSGSPSQGVEKAVASFLNHSQFRLERLERAVLYANEEDRRRVEGHVTRMRNAIYPFGKPQERVYSVFSFLFREGFPVIDQMLGELECTRSGVQEIEL